MSFYDAKNIDRLFALSLLSHLPSIFALFTTSVNNFEVVQKAISTVLSIEMSSLAILLKH